MLPIDVATQHTTAFLAEHLDLPGTRLLEVGCGEGHLAATMKSNGAEVLAIDRWEDAVSATRKLGVEAQQCDVLDFQSNDVTFDAVVFSRSLHHIHPVLEAVRKAHSLLSSGGILIVEDFAAEKADEKALHWLKSRFEELPPSEVRTEDHNGHKHAFPVSSVEEWKHHHFEKHKVAESRELETAARKCFRTPEFTAAPYLYRYLINKCSETDRAGIWLETVLQSELEAINRGELRAIGLRIVARK